ncbi:MAG: PHA/PHB synthase family protein [Acidimicrobiia bacterium]
MSVSESRVTSNGKGQPRSRRARPASPPPPPEPEPSAAGEGSGGAGLRAAEILAPETGLATLDPISFGKAVERFGSELARQPLPTARALARYGAGLALTGAAAAGRAFGIKAPGPVAPAAKDRRFSDPAWEQNPAFFGAYQAYRLFAKLTEDLLEVAELEEPWDGKARFLIRMLVDAASPSNFLWGNPTALKRAFDSGGLSLMRGARNFLTDVATNGGLPRKVDRSAFTVGKNLAATPGKVVFRNDLMELLQYEPATSTTYEVPLLLSPPWINKYYIMDLAPGRSFVQWAVDHGHTVFAISYRNPDRTMSALGLDDYLIDGPRQALDVIGEITGCDKANMVGLCLGGSLTAMTLAHMAESGDHRVNSATLLNTLIDFSEPGVLGSFSDAESVSRIEAKMSAKGFLDAKDMSRTFDLMRANDLIWSYVASGWLMGEDPPAFDILAWNDDSTRMPAAMHAFYLQSCYIRNELARGEMDLAGVRLHLSKIEADAYILAAKEDHIAPWTSAYKTTQLLSGETRFVLSSSGHIAGIVNPPSPKSRHWTNPATPADPQAWLGGAIEHEGSWWEDWTDWVDNHAGPRRPPPPMGSDTHPPLGEAPGTYVHAQ